MPNFYQKRQKVIYVRNIEMAEKEDKWEQLKNLPNTYTDIKVWERIEMNDSEFIFCFSDGTEKRYSIKKRKGKRSEKKDTRS